MAKSKNHTNHNQSRKAHRNGIKRLDRNRLIAKRGVCVKFLRNQRYVQKGNKLALRNAQKAQGSASLKSKKAFNPSKVSKSQTAASGHEIKKSMKP